MQAKTVDELRLLAYYLLKVNGNDVQQPQTVSRPGESREPETVSLAELGNLLKE